MDAEREEHQQVKQHFTQSLFRAGAGLALIPISMLPRGTQQHFKAAGQEFTRGVAKLAHEFADELDEKAKEEK